MSSALRAAALAALILGIVAWRRATRARMTATRYEPVDQVWP